jgi:hypothetical protein
MRRTRLHAASIVAALAVALAACCVARHARPPAAGTFVEDFEGFPIYHGDPGRPYVALGPVRAGNPGEIGVGPMKRAAVAEARRLGADAIVLLSRESPAAPGDRNGPASSPAGKWQHAIAVRWP